MYRNQKEPRPSASRDVGVYRAKARERMRREDEVERRKAIRELKKVSQAIYDLEGKLYKVMQTANLCFQSSGNPRYSSLAEEIRLSGGSLQAKRQEVNEVIMEAGGELPTEHPPLVQDMKPLYTSAKRIHRTNENKLFSWRNGGF